jgi:hypothetical protein
MKASEKKLALIPFQFQIQGMAADTAFFSINFFDISQDGEFLVLDYGAGGLLRFDAEGRYRANLAANILGRPETMCSVHFVDTTLALHSAGWLQLLNRKGVVMSHHEMNGIGDVSFNSKGYYVVNRMNTSSLTGYCLETYDSKGKPIAKMHKSRASKGGEGYRDFALSRVFGQDRIVYAPVFNDTIYIYNFAGQLLKSKVLASPFSDTKMDNGKTPRFEDLYINREGIFIARMDYTASQPEGVFINKVEKYDFDLNLNTIYQLPEPISIMPADLPIFAQWYHRFSHYNGRFYFIVSKPRDHLAVYEVL